MYHAIVFLPLVGFLLAGLFGRVLGPRPSEIVTTALLFVSAALSWYAFVTFGFGTSAEPGSGPVVQRIQIAQWLASGDLVVDWAFRIDTLTVVMLVVVNTVSALVHLYSVGYMHEDPHRPRFFAYLSLFTFAMLMLVTADNLVQMFFGWEGVGLASYLLIGFWYQKDSANAAAMKAFIVNRVGDFGFLLGIFTLFVLFNSVSFDQIFPRVAEIANNRFMFLGITAFFAATVGLVQNDIKRVIAYSTCSQLGYMFVGLGVGAYGAGVFHLFTHAFFKALLFLGAGSVIHAMHHEQDIRHMGGLRRYVPFTAAVMAIGTLALTGFPFTAGYYSKDAIIEAAFASHRPGAAFAFLATVVAAMMTSFYSWRLFFMTFEQQPRWAGHGAGHHVQGDHEGVEHDDRSHDLEPAQAVDHQHGGHHGEPAEAADHEHGGHHGESAPHESPLVMLVPLAV